MNARGGFDLAHPTNLPTVVDVRERCLALGLPISADEVQTLVTVRPRLQLDRALRTDDSDAAARQFLSRAIEQVRRSTPPLFPERNLKPLSQQPTFAKPWATRFPSAIAPRTKSAHDAATEQVAAVSPRRLEEDRTPAVRDPDSHHVYASHAALTFSTGFNRHQQAVIFIDAAAAKGPRSFDWARKSTLMLTPGEVLLVLAAFVGDLPHARFAHHGPARDKWLELTHQGGQVFVRIGQRKEVLAVPVGATDAFQVTAMLLAQVKASLPVASQTDALTLLRKTVARMAAIAPVGPQREAPSLESGAEAMVHA